MTDIVERLRKREFLTKVGKDNSSIYRDAADEIEQLRRDIKVAIMGDSAELTDVKKEIERLRKRLAEVEETNRRVSDEIVLQRQSIKKYVHNLTRITNDMLLEISISESKA